MASSLSSRLSSVRRNTDSLETERQNFIKRQQTSVNKAINAQEVPVKEKHVRSIIIGTFQEKGASTFWSVVCRLPVQGTPVVCWKFCHTLHKVLREGHEEAQKQLREHTDHLKDLGRMWGHFHDGYGKLNAAYCSLLNTKLEFHKKNPLLPGNLVLPQPEKDIEKMCENDINNYFQMSVEIFDYLESLIALQAAVFKSFNLSKPMSGTPSGQCRLSPLIAVILDSGQLYDFSVRLLYKLHACLPEDTLDGHRSRFLKQFHALKEFYAKCSSIIYYRRLIQVPTLPAEPPNFFVASMNQDTYISPAVMLALNESMLDGSGRDSPPPPSEASSIEEPVFEKFEEPVMHSAMLVDLMSSPPPQQNGQQSQQQQIQQSGPDERDWIIEQLREEVNQLKFELERTKKEDQRIIEALKKRLMEMEQEMNEHRTVVETQCEENETLRDKVKELEHAALMVSEEKLVDAERRSKVNEERFKKMKDVYNKLREEHLGLLRVNAEANKQLTTVSKCSEETVLARQTAEQTVEKLQMSIAQTASREAQLKRQMEEQRKKLLAKAVEAAEETLRLITQQMDDPQFASATCTPEYLQSRAPIADECVNNLERCFNSYQQNSNDFGGLIGAIASFSQSLGEYMLQGKATSNLAPVDVGERLSSNCHATCSSALTVLHALKEEDQQGFTRNEGDLRENLRAISNLTQELISEEISSTEEIGDLVEAEMQSTTDLVDQAASRIEEMLKRSREADTGVKLEVNERILDSCTQLMICIKELITKSKSLQQEIVASGRGSATAKEFYKRHHRWTEGLLSAAKLVGVGASHLVDSSDKLMKGKGKFEELMVCSHEIAASTAQLVAASKVKADKGSPNLKGLQVASRNVATATAGVVASAKTGAQMIEEGDSPDFTKMTLTQTKRMEMEAQVTVIELESKLEKERVKLAELRKQHYQLAGASEGWEEGEDGDFGGQGEYADLV
ncbi:huntingtin-interacting protein 1 isoform X1 [Strongylocentrotus purpuratus]|uniref:Huntingtin interacting protein 1 n=1 Tax=Strongylocentrotus purpuratus TaxID=7668 RepID=A0A7M7RBH0_STRPU|nr:huntingtin-interacting protein 1 isoform X1 [Strongylocentrotus purpuratus]